MTNIEALFTNLKVWARRVEMAPPTHNLANEKRIMAKLDQIGISAGSRRTAIFLIAGKILFDDFDYSRERADKGGLIVADLVYGVCHGDLTFAEIGEEAERRITESSTYPNDKEQIISLAKNMIAARHGEYQRPPSMADHILRKAGLK